MEKVADLSFLASFTGGDAEKMNKYINLFLKHAPAMLNSIEENLAKKDWASVRTSAHSFKPQISYMGIKSAEELIKSIEKNAGEQVNLDNLPDQVMRLKEILDKAYPELKKATEPI
jgi:HPt (histidine-containing phosphotransfer) domain-containing protein